VSSAKHSLDALRALAPAEAEALGVVHTLREILQQPRMWLDTFERVRAARSELTSLFHASGLGGPRPPEVVLIGAGSSDFAARLVAPAFRLQWAARTSVLASTDLLTQTRALLWPEGRYLFVWFSRSGTTPEAVELLALLEREFADSHHLLITCNSRGEFARRPRSDRSFCLTLSDAVHDRGLAMTSSFTSMTLAGLLSALDAERVDALRASVASLSAAAESLIERSAADLLRLAQRRHSSVFFLGSGSLKDAAGESALKLLELSAGRVETRFDSFLGARHGPLSCLDPESALLGLISATPAERVYETELVREVRAKELAGTVALLTPQAHPTLSALADPCIDLGVPRGLPAPFRPLLDVIAGQLLALFTSLTLRIRADSPSLNGAITRVVTRIRPSADGQSGETP
jgi:tagatose-6-phosphate ketose/aldose isomerase